MLVLEVKESHSITNPLQEGFFLPKTRCGTFENYDRDIPCT